MANKYQMFKNFLHNELELSKEDTKQWIVEAIQEEVHKVVKDESFYETILKQALNKTVDYNFSQSIKEKVSREVSKQIIPKIDIKIRN